MRQALGRKAALRDLTGQCRQHSSLSSHFVEHWLRHMRRGFNCMVVSPPSTGLPGVERYKVQGEGMKYVDSIAQGARVLDTE